MKIRTFAAAALCLAATSMLADVSSGFADWINGPVRHIMTRDEQSRFRAIKTDAEAQAFIDLFWARRDPTPETPRNEAREQFDARVAWADKNLKEGRVRGALTDRGMVFVLYGQPKRIERSPVKPTVGGSLEDSETWIQFVYEDEAARNLFQLPKATFRFVDQSGTQNFKIERGLTDLAAAQERVIKRMIVRPDLTTVTAAAAAPAAPVAAPVAAAAPAAPQALTALTTPALAAAVTDFKAAAKNPYADQAFLAWGEYVTPTGHYFVPVMLYLPKSAGLTAEQQVTFFGVFEDETGKSVLAFEEPRKLHPAQGGDVFLDKSLTLPAGKHRGLVGVSYDGKVIIGSANMPVAGTLDHSAAAISPLLLSNFIQPLAEAQAPTDPFAFGGVKVVPKADKTFRKTDELWYFFELRNPGLSDGLTADQGSATGAPSEPRPKIQVKMDMQGTTVDGKPVKMVAPPREVDAAPMKGVPGHYGVGNAIPLETFKPGHYTFTLKVIDTVKKASYTLSDTFRVVE